MILALAALERSIRNVAGNNRRLQRGQNAMKNKKWKKFQLLTEECYNNMIGFGENNDCWKQVFELLMEIVLGERWLLKTIPAICTSEYCNAQR